MSNWFSAGLHQIGGPVDLNTADVRALMTMSNFSFAVEKDKTQLSAMALDEYDGTNYARFQLQSKLWVRDTTLDIAKITADDHVFPSLGGGTRQASGLLLFVFVTDDTDHIPLGHVDDGGFPTDGVGVDKTILWSNGVVLQLAAKP